MCFQIELRRDVPWGATGFYTAIDAALAARVPPYPAHAHMQCMEAGIAHARIRLVFSQLARHASAEHAARTHLVCVLRLSDGRAKDAKLFIAAIAAEVATKPWPTWQSVQ